MTYQVTFIGGPADLTRWALSERPYPELYVPIVEPHVTAGMDLERSPVESWPAVKRARYTVVRIPNPAARDYLFVAVFDRVLD